MRWLQEIMVASGVQLALGLPVSQFNPWPESQPGSPLRILAEMLPPEEGGTDQGRLGERRIDRHRMEMVPWFTMPAALLQVPGPLGIQLQQIFGDTASLTDQPGLAQSLKDKQQFDETLKSALREVGDSKARTEAMRKEEQKYRPKFRDDAGPSIRQLILRGKYEEATTALVLLADQLRASRERLQGTASEAKALQWASEVAPIYADYLRAQRSRDPQELIQAEKALDEVRQRAQPALEFAHFLAAGHALTDVTYLIAVCKGDQLEARLRRSPSGDETKAAAQTAVQAWELFLAQNPNSTMTGAAMRLLARAQHLAGDFNAASETYRRAAEKSAGIERAACLILADEVKAK
jgi:hypothetical protein